MRRRSQNLRRQYFPHSKGSRATASRRIDRREFVRTGSGLLLLGGLGVSCGDDGTGPPSTDTGTVRVTIAGLQPGFTSAGVANVVGPGIDRDIVLPNLNTGQAVVPVGTYEVVYTPPTGYAIAAGTSNTTTVVVVKNQITDVAFTVVLATGTLRINVAGLETGPANAGSTQVLRTDIGGQTAITVIVPLSGTIDTTVLPGTYSVTYTPPDGFALTAGANPQSVVVGAVGVGTASFTIQFVVTTGTLTIAVVGLLAGAANGGSASVLRTDIAGQTPVIVNIPVSGTAQSTLTAGTYSVTYTPPAGHQLAGGQAATEVANVVAGAGTTVTFDVQAAVVPGGVVFRSDWSTALGTSAAALLDTGKPLPWDMQIGNGSLNQIVPATAGLDFPASMANTFQNIAQQGGPGVLTQFCSLQVAAAHLPVPAVGQSLFYRWYQRFAVPDSIDTNGGAPHPMQDGPAASQINWMWEVVVNSNGTWVPRWSFSVANAFPGNRWAAPALPKNQTFRIELRIHRLSATTFTPESRIFNSTSSTPVRGNADFLAGNGTGPTSFASAPVLNIENLNYFTGFQCGNNGPGWSNNSAAAFPFTLWYVGGVAIRTDDWCGPYSGGV